ncbi:hypothetical protein CASFOL_030781 [Castilleja foliolosa]|uniref:RING-type domain-containing protein n=1 Tax=Castilleja foliolosa TaxID=1961234 RepID=A0ABD3C6W9_9LAMI
MGLVSGYQHHYNFSYTEAPISADIGVQIKILVFKIRTSFILLQRKKLDDAYEHEIMDTEDLSITLPLDQIRHSPQKFHNIVYRLDEYLMSDDQILSFIYTALDYAQQISAAHPSRLIVPIFADVLVCTVQLDGEPLDEAIDRSVRPDCLVPLKLLEPDVDEDSCHHLRDYLLRGLPRIRGDDVHVEGFGSLMETCSICLGGPTAAAPVSLLPCRHAFHSHCVVRWLMVNDSCPLCRAEKIVRLEKPDTLQVNTTQDRPTTQSQETNHLPRPARVGRLVTRARYANHLPRSARVRRAPAWHEDYVMGSTNHLPVPTRVRRSPAWHNDYVIG